MQVEPGEFEKKVQQVVLNALQSVIESSNLVNRREGSRDFHPYSRSRGGSQQSNLSHRGGGTARRGRGGTFGNRAGDSAFGSSVDSRVCWICDGHGHCTKYCPKKEELLNQMKFKGPNNE